MASTTAELQDIARTLDKIRSAGAGRIAAGAGLRALSPAYDQLARISATDRRNARKNELEIARTNLERWMRNLTAHDGADITALWKQTNGGRDVVLRAYTAIAGVEGEANYKPQTSNWEILLMSLKEAPAVFGEAVGAIAGATGKAAGDVAGGLLFGLGLGGLIRVGVIVAIVAIVVTKGTIIGRVKGLISGLG